MQYPTDIKQNAIKKRVFPFVLGISQTRALSILGVTFQEVADLLHM